jgi:hypothetical protein
MMRFSRDFFVGLMLINGYFGLLTNDDVVVSKKLQFRMLCTLSGTGGLHILNSNRFHIICFDLGDY